jgi:hypothetical protein
VSTASRRTGRLPQPYTAIPRGSRRTCASSIVSSRCCRQAGRDFHEKYLLWMSFITPQNRWTWNYVIQLGSPSARSGCRPIQRPSVERQIPNSSATYLCARSLVRAGRTALTSQSLASCFYLVIEDHFHNKELSVFRKQVRSDLVTGPRPGALGFNVPQMANSGIKSCPKLFPERLSAPQSDWPEDGSTLIGQFHL